MYIFQVGNVKIKELNNRRFHSLRVLHEHYYIALCGVCVRYIKKGTESNPLKVMIAFSKHTVSSFSH